MLQFRMAYTNACVLALGLLCSACESLPQKVQVDFAQPTTAPAINALAVSARPATGSLYQTASYRPPFEDRRARLAKCAPPACKPSTTFP